MEKSPAPRLNAALPRARDDGVVGAAIEWETAKDQSAKSGFLPINQQPSSAHAMFLDRLPSVIGRSPRLPRASNARTQPNAPGRLRRRDVLRLAFSVLERRLDPDDDQPFRGSP